MSEGTIRMIEKRIGILGGGQLGKMIFQAGSTMLLDISFLDKSSDYPAGLITKNFTEGDIANYDDIIAFGQNMDVISIEIERVNVEALKVLKEAGKDVFPSPEIIGLIQDKGDQKKFYKDHGFDTSPFILVDSTEDIYEGLKNGSISYPFVQKSRRGGYDGRGVAVINGQNEIHKILEGPCVIEEKVDIDKEIAVLVCRNKGGEVAIYDPVEMVFDDEANLLDYQLAPAAISRDQNINIHELALKMASKLDLVGLLAIELFLDKEGNIIVNEMAPRPHNSGHHTIEACYTGQYENLLRAILNLPLGCPDIISPSILVNLLGSPDYRGETVYSGISEIMNLRGANLHLYGKNETRPHRKMGHVTILHEEHYSPHESKDIIKRVFKTVPKILYNE